MIVHCRTLEEIESVLERFCNVLPSLSRGRTFRAEMAEKFFRNGQVICLSENGLPLAFAAFYCNDLAGRNAYLSMIAVRRDAQGKGYGKKLLAYVERAAQKSGMDALRLEVSKQNVSAIAFYSKNGYSPVEFRAESMICRKNWKMYTTNDKGRS